MIYLSMKNKFIKNACLLLLFLSVAFNITYWAMAKYNVFEDLKASGDAAHYINMSEEDYSHVFRRYFNRFLAPAIVSMLNRHLEFPQALVSNYEDIDKKMIQLNFGIVNIIFLAGTAFLFFYYLKDLKFSEWEALTGCLLFFTSFFVVTYYTTPLVDAAGCFFFMACVYAVYKNNLLWLAVSFLLGMLTKETTLLIFIVIFINDRNIFSKKLLVCLPALIPYFLLVNVGHGLPGSNDFHAMVSFSSYGEFFTYAFKDYTLYRFIELTQVYMFLWVLLLYAVFKCKKPEFIRYQAWVIVVPMAIELFIGSALAGRIAFYTFPFMIPLAMLALREILEPVGN